ncbi:MAG: hypothetical protein R3B13_15625 [Polyangiaceae bacterium]
MRAQTPAAPSPTSGTSAPNESDGSAKAPTEQPWCTEDVEALSDGMCHFVPDGETPPDTLVIFLHGVVKVGTTWQYAQEQALKRMAGTNRFEVLMPRGRIGAGSKRFHDHYTWPTGPAAQKELEAEVLQEWMDAKALLEARNGRAFDKVFVLGFSAGAYYASSLMLRGRLPVQGYGIFAGGGAPKHVERWAKGVHPKARVYVGWGEKDKAKKDPKGLAKALRVMRWPHKALGRRKVGHSMTDAQVREALAFLRGQRR